MTVFHDFLFTYIVRQAYSFYLDLLPVTPWLTGWRKHQNSSAKKPPLSPLPRGPSHSPWGNGHGDRVLRLVLWVWACQCWGASCGGAGWHRLVTGTGAWQQRSWKVPLGMSPLEVAINPTIEPIASSHLIKNISINANTIFKKLKYNWSLSLIYIHITIYSSQNTWN